MTFDILHWNIHGLYNNLNELKLLIKDLSPSIVCLQETHIPFNRSAPISNSFHSYFHNLPHNATSKQGICVMVKKGTPHKLLDIISPLSVIAVEVNLGFKFTVVSVYIPPQQPFNLKMLLDITSSITTDILLIGDLNAWSPLWGSPSDNSRGKIVEDFILLNNYIVLNDLAPTHFSTHQTFTHVDVSMCSASLAPKLSCSTSPFLHGSDHFYLLTKVVAALSNPGTPKPKFITQKANWELFQRTATVTSFKYNQSSTISKEANNITKTIRTAAHLSIPQTQNKFHKTMVPYWSQFLSSLRNKKQTLWHNYKRHRSLSNLLEYKKSNGYFKQKLKDAKRQSLEVLTSTITPDCSPKKILSYIKMLSGTFSPLSIKVLDTPHGPINSSADMANHFGSVWSSYSKDSNFHPNFVAEKNLTLIEKYVNNSPSPSAQKIESPITIFEFEVTINSMSGKTPGRDRISYSLLQNLPSVVKTRLVNLYNAILSQGILPHTWKNALVLPIPKSYQCGTSASDCHV